MTTEGRSRSAEEVLRHIDGRVPHDCHKERVLPEDCAACIVTAWVEATAAARSQS